LNPEFAKAWRMGIALDIPGLTSFNYGETVAITVAGTTGVANNVCPTGGGSLSLTGSEKSASWSGNHLPCDPMFHPIEHCLVTLNFISGSLVLIGSGNTLQGNGTGTATGCNLNNAPLSMTFDAVPAGTPGPIPPPATRASAM
jgi:hypothetical protein